MQTQQRQRIDKTSCVGVDCARLCSFVPNGKFNLEDRLPESRDDLHELCAIALARRRQSPPMRAAVSLPEASLSLRQLRVVRAVCQLVYVTRARARARARYRLGLLVKHNGDDGRSQLDEQRHDVAELQAHHVARLTHATVAARAAARNRRRRRRCRRRRGSARRRARARRQTVAEQSDPRRRHHELCARTHNTRFDQWCQHAHAQARTVRGCTASVTLLGTKPAYFSPALLCTHEQSDDNKRT